MQWRPHTNIRTLRNLFNICFHVMTQFLELCPKILSLGRITKMPRNVNFFPSVNHFLTSNLVLCQLTLTQKLSELHSYFTDEEIEAQRTRATCQGTQLVESKSEIDSRFPDCLKIFLWYPLQKSFPSHSTLPSHPGPLHSHHYHSLPRFFLPGPPGEGFLPLNSLCCFSSVQFSHSVLFNSLQPRGEQCSRLLCPSPTPRACSSSCPSSQ